jgi:hypothetical protein
LDTFNPNEVHKSEVSFTPPLTLTYLSSFSLFYYLSYAPAHLSQPMALAQSMPDLRAFMSGPSTAAPPSTEAPSSAPALPSRTFFVPTFDPSSTPELTYEVCCLFCFVFLHTGTYRTHRRHRSTLIILYLLRRSPQRRQRAITSPPLPRSLHLAATISTRSPVSRLSHAM